MHRRSGLAAGWWRGLWQLNISICNVKQPWPHTQSQKSGQPRQSLSKLTAGWAKLESILSSKEYPAELPGQVQDYIKKKLIRPWINAAITASKIINTNSLRSRKSFARFVDFNSSFNSFIWLLVCLTLIFASLFIPVPISQHIKNGITSRGQTNRVPLKQSEFTRIEQLFVRSELEYVCTNGDSHPLTSLNQIKYKKQHTKIQKNYILYQPRIPRGKAERRGWILC